MPIYSRNSIGGVSTVAANENYSYADMGRILVECVQNNMIVFNAALFNDFKENSAIREGTMVSSELNAFREFSVKEAWKNLKEKLKKLWEKIKGVFRQVYAKLTVWLVRNGKVFVAMNRKILANKTGLGDCEIPNYSKVKDNDFGKEANSIATWITQTMSKLEDGTNSKKYGANSALGAAIPDATTENFTDEYNKRHFDTEKDVKWSAISSDVGNVEGLFTAITTKSDAIKKLKKLEKDTDSAIKKAIKALDSKASSAEKEKQGSGEAYKNASTAISSFERAITISTKCGINAIKKTVKQARMIVGKLVAYSPNKENALLEQMAWREGADDFDTQEDIPADEINAPDVQSDPDVVVNVDVESEDECNC